MIAGRWFSPLLLTALVAAVCPMPSSRAQQAFDLAAAERRDRHQSAEWLSMVPHLPDPATGSSASLETAGDVLRARRMPEDALDFYAYALQRGGDEARLRNRIGVTELELRQTQQALTNFKRALLLSPRSAEGWNNLGAAEYIAGNFQSAIKDYQKAVKLDKKGAVYHSNLGTAYFERSDYESARTQFDLAIRLDRNVFQRGGWGGIQAHVMSAKDRGRFCFEMARLAARTHDDEAVIRWLAQASETGYDVKYEMLSDRVFDLYRKDVRVDRLIHNAKAMRAGQVAAIGDTPTLAQETPQKN